jgi:adenosylcobinamide kinase / adenosylcobinamide-phosphate guanylyltransferase
MGYIILVTGGARSGKSRHAERRLRELAPEPPWLYFATAEAFDDEMRERIAVHRERRGAGWRTVEAPRDLPEAIQRELRPGTAGLVDCITLWISNLMLADTDDENILVATTRLAEVARSGPAPIILVTNEVGAGIVPDNRLARRFRDLAGIVNQRLAAVAEEVVLVACGLPLRLR